MCRDSRERVGILDARRLSPPPPVEATWGGSEFSVMLL